MSKSISLLYKSGVILSVSFILSACGGEDIGINEGSSQEPITDITPSVSPSPIVTMTPIPSATPTPLITPTPVATPIVISTLAPTATPTPAVTSTPVATPTPISSSSPTPSPTPVIRPSATPLATPTPTPSPSITPTPVTTPSPNPVTGIGELIWEDNFDSLDTSVWTIDIGDGCDQGLCGWGNAELQWYAENNVSIAAVPGESGNTALRFDAKRESVESRAFTSGKVNSANKLAVHYGLIEVRMRVPDLETGLWPAAWMLGTSTLSWPRKGEIDMMEMGHRDAEITRQGHEGTTQNSYVGSNLIFYSDDACSDGNPTCAASIAYDVSYDKPYVSDIPMNDRFVTYRTYWTESYIRFTIIDNGVEYDLYESPFLIGEDSAAFQKPFYLLLNLAVGGTFTDAAVNSDITAPLPASMYIDYVRVYELDGQGEVLEGNLTSAEIGSLGVFTDTTNTDNIMQAGLDSQVFLWDPNSSAGTQAPYEGDNVLTWNVDTAGAWFGAGIQTDQARDLSLFGEGSLSFMVKIPADIDFRIGITDTYGNENWVILPAGESKYGMTRSGDWERVTIPVSELRGTTIALQSLQYVFAISSNPTNLPNQTFSYAVDDIYWVDENGLPQSVTPTPVPSSTPTSMPTSVPTITPTSVPTLVPTAIPTPTVTFTPSPTPSPVATATPVPNSTYGVNISGAGSAEFYIYTSGTGILHYRVNSGGQLNVNMSHEGERFVYIVSGLYNGDEISYFFTYTHPEFGYNVDSPTVVYTYEGSDTVTVPTPTPTSTTIPVSINDADNDGVNDDDDLCASTFSKEVDANGCAVQTELSFAKSRLVGGIGSSKPNLTLYTFDNDLAQPGTSTCNGGCASSWPPLLVGDDGIADGLDGVGSILRDDGSEQVTFDGRPLYFYAGDTELGDTNGQGLGGVWFTVPFGVLADITALYNSDTELEPDSQWQTDEALITRFSDRPRTRHAREDQFQSYDHYVKFYFEHRSSNIEIIDTIPMGGDTITMNVRTLWPLDDLQAENRWWYWGQNTLAHYAGNGTMEYLGTDGTYFYYTKSDNRNRQFDREIQMGDRLEFEISQFSRKDIPRGQENYYGSTFLYIVGEGIVPWYTENTGEFVEGREPFQEDSFKIPEEYWLGGLTTLHYQYTNEPNDHFMQMATNLGYDNAQKFLEGRRVHHSSAIDGTHDEDIENGVFEEMVGLGGKNYVNQRCTDCHERNGSAPVAADGELLDRWVFKVGDANGNPDPLIGRVLQPKSISGEGEGEVIISSWTELSNGLRTPNYEFSDGEPAQFSARIAPRIVGMGLLEAIPESTILAMADPDDSDNDGISGRANFVNDPANPNSTRLGRFGWKAGTASVEHQVAAALNTDMGVMTALLPTPDCGSQQTNCGVSGQELANEPFENLVAYISLLGVRPQRGWESGYEDQTIVAGKEIFEEINCSSCHTPTLTTSAYHPHAELRNQTIHPYTDLLVHDMGEGLADNLAEGGVSGREWRTAPLWGLGLSACVTGGVTNPTGMEGDEICTPHHAYLHDGRARSIEEAILWHGGESQASNDAYQALSSDDKNALLRFLESL